MRQWLRSYFRKKTGPIPVEYARRMKFNLSLVYAALAWNILGLTVYLAWRQNVPRNHDSVDYAKMLGIKEAKVMRFSGLQKVTEYDIKLSDGEIQEYLSTVGDREKQEALESKWESDRNNRSNQ